MHSVKYAYIEIYFSINNENILDLSKRNVFKVFRRFYGQYQSLLKHSNIVT